MGLSAFIGDKEIRLASAANFNLFLNEIAAHGDFPELSLRSFSEGKILIDYDGEPDLLKSSVRKLLRECQGIKVRVPLSDGSDYILSQIIRACNESLRQKKDIELQ